MSAYLSRTQLARRVSRLRSTAARLKIKGIGECLHKRPSTWLNRTRFPRTLPGLDMSRTPRETGAPAPSGAGRGTGGEWLSSARAVRRWVHSQNGRNPCLVLPAGISAAERLWRCAGHSPGTAVVLAVGYPGHWRKVGMRSSRYAPYALGCTRATVARTKSAEAARRR